MSYNEDIYIYVCSPSTDNTLEPTVEQCMVTINALKTQE